VLVRPAEHPASRGIRGHRPRRHLRHVVVREVLAQVVPGAFTDRAGRCRGAVTTVLERGEGLAGRRCDGRRVARVQLAGVGESHEAHVRDGRGRVRAFLVRRACLPAARQVQLARQELRRLLKHGVQLAGRPGRGRGVHGGCRGLERLRHEHPAHRGHHGQGREAGPDHYLPGPPVAAHLSLAHWTAATLVSREERPAVRSGRIYRLGIAARARRACLVPVPGRGLPRPARPRTA
jgi:hypothetical protein